MKRALLALLLLFGCGSGAPPYAECLDNLDCGPPSDACYRILYTRSDGSPGEGSMCSTTCTTDAECPDGGACIALADDPEGRFFCAARCEANLDCYVGLACTPVVGATRSMALCLPQEP